MKSTAPDMGPVGSGLGQATVELYVAAWNEPDEALRRALLERSWADGASYTDPSVDLVGREALVEHSRRFAGRWPGATVALASGVEEHHGWLRFGWVVRGGDGEVLRDGVDFARLGDDGRLGAVVGFFGPLPALEPPPTP